MKKILITGSNSYIGTSFEKWVKQYPDKYSVDTYNMVDDSWKEKLFEGYDVVLHVAAIVHVKENNADKYNLINRDLTAAVAQKAKADRVKQFIFMSTMGVYGNECEYITSETEPNPETFYAKSKLEAEKLLNNMSDDYFRIAILRPPIVYGKGCRGNYPRLAKWALKLPVFPNIANKRSMIYIDNLCEFLRIIIEDCSNGLFFPQNKEYVNTSELVKLISEVHGKKIRLTKLLNLVWIGTKISRSCQKVFGSLTYAKEMSGYADYILNNGELKYETVVFEDSIKYTELRNLSKERKLR